MAAGREEPQVVKIARLVPGPVQERDDLLGCRLVQGVDPDPDVLG